ncbi:MAG: hypothetical protein ABSF29_07065 [Tepidisphaeraceae bacterium]|jgi:hypothetical protein
MSWRAGVLVALLLLLPQGCNAIGAVAYAAPQPKVAAAYGGLKNQRVGIMVWTDSATTADHPTIQADVARAIYGKLQEASDAGIGDVKDVKWVGIDDTLRFQEDHPEMEADAAEDVALRLPISITRLIYVEITGFSLHADEAVDLSRGSATANLKVVEIASQKATVAYQEENISIIYPSNAPPEGLPDLDEDHVYHESVDTLAKEVATRFVTHEADAE